MSAAGGADRVHEAASAVKIDRIPCDALALQANAHDAPA
jgi:hypothetical protein